MHAFAQLTVPEIKAGLLAVIAFGAAAVALFVLLSMLRAAAGALARCIARLAKRRAVPVRHRKAEPAAGRTGRPRAGIQIETGTV